LTAAAETSGRRVEPDLAIHPGELLAEELEARGMTQRRLAASMGRPPQVINEIVRGKKAITAQTAVQLEAAMDIPARFWLNMQTSYELALARAAVRTPEGANPAPRRSAGRAGK